jgi:DNA-binding transcriptional ArsR family regulator
MKKTKQTRRRILERQCEICKAMAHPVRLEIVETLGQDEMPASVLLEALETSKGNLCKHIAILRHAGIVEQRREGRQVHYRLTHVEIHQACSIMRSILYRRLKKEEQLASAIGAPGAW